MWSILWRSKQGWPCLRAALAALSVLVLELTHVFHICYITAVGLVSDCSAIILMLCHVSTVVSCNGSNWNVNSAAIKEMAEYREILP